MNIAIPVPKRELTFRLYPIHTHFNRISGIYTFLIIPDNYPYSQDEEEPPTNTPTINPPFYNLLYVGIATNLYSRLKSHHKIAQAVSLGMTHIGIQKMSSGRKRKTTEKILLQTYNPALNQTWL